MKAQPRMSRRRGSQPPEFWPQFSTMFAANSVRNDRRGLRMIGLAPTGRPRPWKIAVVITALQRAFPGREVRPDRLRGREGSLFVVYRHGALLVAPERFAQCPDEASVDALIAKAALKMRPELLVELTAQGQTITPIVVERRPVVVPPSALPVVPHSRSRFLGGRYCNARAR